ncbi:hypothetical protein O9H85_17640 [Paenibacillus filicis]|uniref:Uncharacterized protein n=1 Tax=Paenibacillus gyeongsangnamensis TaxID=3388067 RepID=A0ABT4QBF5_9BACL|nr:hypothetical protein [Paenibacillus filicis]MCZ8514218.1 hypothetical protein [Paenibacillus filicis]
MKPRTARALGTGLFMLMILTIGSTVYFLMMQSFFIVLIHVLTMFVLGMTMLFVSEKEDGQEERSNPKLRSYGR